MDRRTLLTTAAAVTTTALAGCGLMSSEDNENPTPRPDTTPSGTPDDTPDDTPEDTPEDGDGELSFGEDMETPNADVMGFLTSVYEARATKDTATIRDMSHSVVDYSGGYFENIPELDGEVVDIAAGIEEQNLSEERLGNLFVDSAPLTDGAIGALAETETMLLTVMTKVEADPANDEQQGYLDFLQSRHPAIIAKENGEWKFVV